MLSHLIHENGSMQVRILNIMHEKGHRYLLPFFFSFLHTEMKFKDKLPCNICNTKCVVLMKRNSLIFFK